MLTTSVIEFQNGDLLIKRFGALTLLFSNGRRALVYGDMFEQEIDITSNQTWLAIFIKLVLSSTQ